MVLVRRFASFIFILSLCVLCAIAAEPPTSSEGYDYRVLATTKTSTMEKEMNEAAAVGFHMEKVMGGQTAVGGSEVVVIMAKPKSQKSSVSYAYKLLATKKTSTMQKELQEVGDEGFDYKDQTVFNSAFGGDEVVVILEADRSSSSKIRYEYKLLATTKTSTMEKELQEAGDDGFKFVGVTVSKTSFGGKEIVSILRREGAR
jgi:hypothetical protein